MSKVTPLHADPKQDRTKKFLEETIARVRTLNEQRAGIAEDIKLVVQEAKCQGLNPKALREVIKLLNMDEEKRDEYVSTVLLYLRALGKEPSGFQLDLEFSLAQTAEVN